MKHGSNTDLFRALRLALIYRSVLRHLSVFHPWLRCLKEVLKDVAAVMSRWDFRVSTSFGFGRRWNLSRSASSKSIADWTDSALAEWNSVGESAKKWEGETDETLMQLGFRCLGGRILSVVGRSDFTPSGEWPRDADHHR